MSSYLHFGSGRWGKLGCSPIWLSFYDADYLATATELRAADWQVFVDEAQCHVAIELRMDVDRAAVIDAAMTQLSAIADALPTKPFHAEAQPPEAVV